MLNLFLDKVRSQGDIALAVASSGIAATLLTGGKTAHSVFKLPLDINRYELPTCTIQKNTARARLLSLAKVVVWDECTMVQFPLHTVHHRVRNELFFPFQIKRRLKILFVYRKISIKQRGKETTKRALRETVAVFSSSSILSSALSTFIGDVERDSVMSSEASPSLARSKSLSGGSERRITVTDVFSKVLRKPTNFFDQVAYDFVFVERIKGKEIAHSFECSGPAGSSGPHL